MCCSQHQLCRHSKYVKLSQWLFGANHQYCECDTVVLQHKALWCHQMAPLPLLEKQGMVTYRDPPEKDVHPSVGCTARYPSARCQVVTLSGSTPWPVLHLLFVSDPDTLTTVCNLQWTCLKKIILYAWIWTSLIPLNPPQACRSFYPWGRSWSFLQTVFYTTVYHCPLILEGTIRPRQYAFAN